MSIELETRLTAAAGTGEILTVVYVGGSQPGTRRDVVVLKINPPYVDVRCLVAEQQRHMRIDRLAMWDGDTRVPIYDPIYARALAVGKAAEQRNRVFAQIEEDRRVEEQRLARRLAKSKRRSSSGSNPAARAAIEEASDAGAPPVDAKRQPAGSASGSGSGGVLARWWRRVIGDG